MSFGTSKSKSKVEFFPGQREIASQIFEPGGIFARILGGELAPGDQRAQQAGADVLGQQFARQGLTGSGIATQGLGDFLTKSTSQISDNQFARLQQLSAPIGQQSSASALNLGVGGS